MRTMIGWGMRRRRLWIVMAGAAAAGGIIGFRPRWIVKRIRTDILAVEGRGVAKGARFVIAHFKEHLGLREWRGRTSCHCGGCDVVSRGIWAQLSFGDQRRRVTARADAAKTDEQKDHVSRLSAVCGVGEDAYPVFTRCGHEP